MLYNNKKYLSILKRVHLISGILVLLAMTVFILLEQFKLVILLGSIFILSLVFIRALNLNFIRFQLENNRIIIRYYSLYAVDRSYESIEFPVASLRQAKVKKYFFGHKWDLFLIVQLKQGIATYPVVCLSAIPSRERVKIVELLKSCVAK